MIKLGKMADYAVALLCHLARGDRDQRQSGAQLARACGIGEASVAKIMKQLVAAGLVVSVRGAQGGFRLARPAATIPIASIIEAIDGPLRLTDCVDGLHGQCGIEAICAQRGNWDLLNRAVRAALASVSLAEMAAPPLWPAAPVNPNLRGMP